MQSMNRHLRSFRLWDLAAWVLATHLLPSDLVKLRKSLRDDPSFVRDAGMSLGLDRTWGTPPVYKKDDLERSGA